MLIFKTLKESHEYKDALKKASEGVIKISILIPTLENQLSKLSLISNEIHWQIQDNGLKGAGLEQWMLSMDTLSEDGTTSVIQLKDGFKHPDEIEIVWGDKDSLINKSKGDYIIYLDLEKSISKNFIKDLVNDMKNGKLEIRNKVYE